MESRYMSDEEHADAMERLCWYCGEPAAFFPGQRCAACWEAHGRELPQSAADEE